MDEIVISEEMNAFKRILKRKGIALLLLANDPFSIFFIWQNVLVDCFISLSNRYPLKSYIVRFCIEMNSIVYDIRYEYLHWQKN